MGREYTRDYVARSKLIIIDFGSCALTQGVYPRPYSINLYVVHQQMSVYSVLYY